MSEEDTKNPPIPEVEYVRFKQPYEDLAGFVIIKDDKLIIDFPLVVVVDRRLGVVKVCVV